MHHDKRFQHHCDFDISNILSVLQQESDWFKDTHRQDTFMCFKQTQSIHLIDAPDNCPYKQQGNVIWNGEDLYWWRLRGPYYDACEPIIKALEEKYNGTATKSVLTRLPAGSKIARHVDGRPLLHLGRRHHIPITTNDDVQFIIEDEIINMKVGECWEIDNTRFHEVKNNGTTDRIHLMVDIVPGDRKDNCEPDCKICDRVRSKSYSIFYEDRYEL